MKTLFNPEHFTFTNRFGGPQFNTSLLQNRIAMMNRQASRSSWRYAAVIGLLLLTAMCQPLVRSEPAQKAPAVMGNQEAILTKSSHVGDTTIIEEYKNGKMIHRTKVWNLDKHAGVTWTGDMAQLMEASFFKRKEAMLYIHPDGHLDVYDEYKKSITVFADQQEISLKDLNKLSIKQIAKLYAHQRPSPEGYYSLTERYNVAVIREKKPTPTLKNTKPPKRRPEDTDYVLWIERIPGRL